MKKDILVVVDMQNDFIYGALGSEEAQAIVPKVIQKVEEFDGTIIFTRDTHSADYMQTQEGKLLPVAHCIENSSGWNLVLELAKLQEKKGCEVYDKNTFGSIELAKRLKLENEKFGIDSIELVGVCTDICVVSNAILIKAYMPEVEIKVDSACCAGVTPQKHNQALEVMKSCQIMIDEVK